LNEESKTSLPLAIWVAYAFLVLVGCGIGFACGAERLSPIGLVIFVFGSLAGFIPWAVWKLDPSTLVDSDTYRSGEASKTGSDFDDPD
jgi:hypothetical protein